MVHQNSTKFRQGHKSKLFMIFIIHKNLLLIRSTYKFFMSYHNYHQKLETRPLEFVISEIATNIQIDLFTTKIGAIKSLEKTRSSVI